MKGFSKDKKGISLIVLVITIIVMIILATAIILSLNGSNIIGKANQVVIDTDKANMIESASVALSEYELATKTGEIISQEKETYVKNKLYTQGFSEKQLNYLSVLDDGTIQLIPRIPAGFIMSPYEGEQKVSEGLVIYKLQANESSIPDTETKEVSQSSRDQYVWVPVEGLLERKVWKDEDIETVYVEPIISGIAYMDDISLYSQEIAQYNAMVASVKKYNGFYIARYEAGKEGNVAVSKRGINVWNNIEFDLTWNKNGYGKDNNDGCAKISKATYEDSERHLIYGVQWDATMNFIADSDHSVTDSSKWGNYKNYNSSVDSSKQVAGAGNGVKTTGFSDNWKAKNIYDIAGNVFEWTYEVYTDYDFGLRSMRGGGCNFSGSFTPASLRDCADPNIQAEYGGFRFVLYLK